MKDLDLFRKASPECSTQTLQGGIFTIAAFSLMTLLIVLELFSFCSPIVSKQVLIDPFQISQSVNITIDIIIPGAPCLLLTLDWQDLIGSFEGDSKAISKSRIDYRGNKILKTADMNYENVANSIEEREGCRLSGILAVRKVPGNFHISFHSHENFIHQLPETLYNYLSLEHIIYNLTLGSDNWETDITPVFGEDHKINKPYSNTKVYEDEAIYKHEHILKIIPVRYTNEQTSESFSLYQYSLNSLSTPIDAETGAIYFRYDFDCITMNYTLKSRSYTQFIIMLCSILGGIFSILGILNSVTQKAINLSNN